MRLPLLSLGLLLALTLIVTGCGGGDTKKTPAPDNTTPATDSNGTSNGETGGQTSGSTSHPSQEAVRQFLLAMVSENSQKAFALFTPKAQEEYRRTGSSLDPKVFQGMNFRITGGDAMPEAGVGFYAVYVDMVNEGELIDAVWGVRKIGDEYRIANLLMSFDGEVMSLDFEDPAGTLSKVAGDIGEQQIPANQAMSNNMPPMQSPQFEGFQPPPNPPQMALPNMPNYQ